jgi:lipid-binding SYLF domain-containing protein
MEDSMKSILLKTAGVLTILFCGLSSAVAVEDYSNSIAVFKKSPVCKPYFDKAYGFAMFPTIGEGAFGIGAAHGDGQVYRGGKVTGYTSMTQLSIGFQAGGQAYSQIIFFEDKRAYDNFTSGNFEFDASASAVVVTAAAQAATGTTGNTAGASVSPSTGKQLAASYYKGTAIFVHTKGGLMYEASIAGQKFNFKPVSN